MDKNNRLSIRQRGANFKLDEWPRQHTRREEQQVCLGARHAFLHALLRWRVVLIVPNLRGGEKEEQNEVWVVHK